MKKILYLLCLLPLPALSLKPSFADERPNIVFFFADDQTTSTLGCYGNDVVQTPNIDALARRGTRFNNAFVSHSICWVSRTTILTGLTGRSYGTPSNPELARPDAAATLYSDILRENGYRTGYFGKWHVERTNDLTEFGWQVNGVNSGELYKKAADEAGGRGKGAGELSLKKTNDLPPGYNQSLLYGVTDVPPEKRGVGITASMGLDFIRGVSEGDDPWCCFVSI
ncbi:MAG: sulfatase-like hydrolase/transferase, partial [Pirellulaceae bacterium]|nr:sulfatase-like hydrolase/transferase [Pirellulaceae bacterium]